MTYEPYRATDQRETTRYFPRLSRIHVNPDGLMWTAKLVGGLLGIGLVVGLTIWLILALQGPTSGTVYAKEFEPAHDVQHSDPQYMQQCYSSRQYNSYNKTYSTVQNCHQVYIGENHWTEHVAPCWRLYFKNNDGDKGDRCVPESTFDAKNIGDFYDKKIDG